MAKSIDNQLASLEALKTQPVTEESIAQLHKALSSKTNLIVAKAASVGAALKLTSLRDALRTAFRRLLDSEDKGCLGKTAIVKALVAMESDNEELYFVGATHVQMEPTWGGQRDAAVELRCQCVAELVRQNSRRMWDPLVRLLADEDAQARSTAGRALGATGYDQARLLLHYKILIGDREPSVMRECFGSILALTRSTNLVGPFLQSPNQELREVAVLALGESRLPEAFKLLRDAYAESFAADRRLLMLAMAMTRQPEAVDLLISLLSSSKAVEPVLEALAMYRSDSAIRARIESAIGDDPSRRQIFERCFGRS